MLVVNQINRHFSISTSPDMTIEKLQKVATSAVEPEYKAKWLHWWNSSTMVRIEKKFPSESPVKVTVLEIWLAKASFWAQVQWCCHLVCRIASPI